MNPRPRWGWVPYMCFWFHTRAAGVKLENGREGGKGFGPGRRRRPGPRCWLELEVGAEGANLNVAFWAKTCCKSCIYQDAMQLQSACLPLGG
jgi:hypothetical protein